MLLIEGYDDDMFFLLDISDTNIEEITSRVKVRTLEFIDKTYNYILKSKLTEILGYIEGLEDSSISVAFVHGNTSYTYFKVVDSSTETSENTSTIKINSNTKDVDCVLEHLDMDRVSRCFKYIVDTTKTPAEEFENQVLRIATSNIEGGTFFVFKLGKSLYGAHYVINFKVLVRAAISNPKKYAEVITKKLINKALLHTRNIKKKYTDTYILRDTTYTFEKTVGIHKLRNSCSDGKENELVLRNEITLASYSERSSSYAHSILSKNKKIISVITNHTRKCAIFILGYPEVSRKDMRIEFKRVEALLVRKWVAIQSLKKTRLNLLPALEFFAAVQPLIIHNGIKQIENNNKQITRLQKESNKSVSATNVTRMLKNIENNKYVSSVSLLGSTLKFTTTPICVVEKQNNIIINRYLGEYKVKLDVFDSNVIEIDNITNKVKGYCEESGHPHQTRRRTEHSPPDFCFGNLMSMYKPFMNDLKIDLMAYCVIDFLRTANIIDLAGKSVSKFPLQEMNIHDHGKMIDINTPPIKRKKARPRNTTRTVVPNLELVDDLDMSDWTPQLRNMQAKVPPSSDRSIMPLEKNW